MSESKNWDEKDTKAAEQFDGWLSEQEQKQAPITYYDDFGELVGVIDEASN